MIVEKYDVILKNVQKNLRIKIHCEDKNLLDEIINNLSELIAEE